MTNQVINKCQWKHQNLFPAGFKKGFTGYTPSGLLFLLLPFNTPSCNRTGLVDRAAAAPKIANPAIGTNMLFRLNI